MHFHTTDLEIETAFNGAPDVIVIGVSTAGQLAGLSNFFKNKYPQTQIWAVDVKGSGVFTSNRHPYKMTGLGLSFKPPAFNWTLLDRAYSVSDELSFSLCYKLCAEEGLFLGASSGSVLAAAYKGIRDLELKDKKICLISSDSGYRYLDTFYNEEWLMQNKVSLLDDEQIKEQIEHIHEHKYTGCEKFFEEFNL